MGAVVTLAIGYYMVYRSDVLVGLCFDIDYPGIRRACILDLGGGVMSMVLGVLLLFIEFASAYINRKDWKITFLVIKIIIAVITTIVLVAGTIQGAASYAEYCDQDTNDYFSYYYGYIYNSNQKLCEFSDGDSQHDADVDFLTIVIVTGIEAFFWVVLLVIEVIRLCIVLIGAEVIQGCCLQGVTTGNSGISGMQTELQNLPIADHGLVTHDYTPSPKRSEV